MTIETKTGNRSGLGESRMMASAWGHQGFISRVAGRC